LAQADKADPARTEALLLRSPSVARRQGALSWELRSTITLAELWQSENRHEAALEPIASVRGRFTESFATAVLTSGTVPTQKQPQPEPKKAYVGNIVPRVRKVTR